jgi:hypothetical protein
MSQSGGISQLNVVPSDVAIDFVTDSGTAVASGHILNILGGSNASTSGSGNTITINSAFNPNKELTVVDDFITNFNGVGYGSLIWAPLVVGVGVNPTNGTSTHPGLLLVNTGYAGTVAGVVLSELSTENFAIGAGQISANFVLNLITLSTIGNRYTVYFGLTNNSSSVVGVPSEGVYFTYNDNINSGNWVRNCTAGGITTSVNTSIAATTSYVNLGMVINAAGTSVSFTINGVSAGSAIVTNIPTASINPVFMWIKASGNLPASLIDLFYMKQTLTTAR